MTYVPQCLVVCCAVLTLVVAIAFAIIGTVSYSMHGAVGIGATAIAAATCWAGSLVALVVTTRFPGPHGAIHGLLLGMLFHMGIPMAAAVSLTADGGPLAQAGLFGQTVIFFLLTLLVETLLSLYLLRQRQAPRNV